MKPRTVKSKVKQLVRHYGRVQDFCDAVGIELSHGYKLMGGIKHSKAKPLVPGKRLYRDICELYTSVYPNPGHKISRPFNDK